MENNNASLMNQSIPGTPTKKSNEISKNSSELIAASTTPKKQQIDTTGTGAATAAATAAGTLTPYSAWKSATLIPIYAKIVIIRNNVDVNAFMMSNTVCRIGR